MAKFYPFTIKDIQRPTEDSVSLIFDVPEDLKQAFQYKPGQHLTIKKDIDGEEVRRSYSLCSSPVEEHMAVAIKRVEGGRFSNYACDHLRPGDEVELMPPTGHFTTTLDPSHEKLYLFFASGSGITPVISLIKTILHEEPESHAILFYGNRTASSIIFKDELEALKNRFLGRLSFHHVLSQEKHETDLFSGRISADKVSAFSKVYFDPAEVDDVFICGPEQMMLNTREALQSNGISEDRIHVELFTSPVGKLGEDKKPHKTHASKHAEITVIIDGTEIPFPYDGNQSVLDAANEHGADLPFSCKGGVCSTCVAKLEEGEVEMDANYALEPDEVEAGLVLTCQSFPKTDKIVLNFDV